MRHSTRAESHLLPLSVICSLFFLWAIGVHLNDILIPHFKGVFHLNDFRSALIQSAFFGGYFLAAFPSGKFMVRYGYKRGIIFGLVTCATGAIMFLPAAYIHAYPLFLLSLFVMACGQSFLEVASNPYVALLGPPDRAAMRLNIAQAVNSLGAVLTPILGSALILQRAERAIHSGRLQSETALLMTPYLGLVGAYFCYAAVIAVTPLPEVQLAVDHDAESSASLKVGAALRNRHLLWGVLAQFFYVGAQVGVASFVIRLAEHQIHGLSDSSASDYLRYHLIGFMVGRIAGSIALAKISPERLLALFGAAAIVASFLVITGSGMTPVWSIVGLGACNSIMFPTIFALSLQGLGPYTKTGSSFLVMAIIGGAVLPVAMGLVSDASDIQVAFIVPLVAYFVVLSFAVFGRKLVEA